jgi:hypothetical protein
MLLRPAVMCSTDSFELVSDDVLLEELVLAVELVLDVSDSVESLSSPQAAKQTSIKTANNNANNFFINTSP